MKLSDARREWFCMHMAGGTNQTNAAKRAGYPVPGSANTASRLMKEPSIRARIDEIKANAGVLTTVNSEGETTVNIGETSQKYITKPFVITKTVETLDLARRAGEHSVSVNCLRLLAQLGGHLSDGTGRNSSNAPKHLTQINLHTMTAKDLGDYLRDQVQGLPAPERKAVESIIDVEAVSSDDESIDDLL